LKTKAICPQRQARAPRSAALLYQFENSPAIYGWVIISGGFKVPPGRKKCPVVPGGTLQILRRTPRAEALGYFQTDALPATQICR
jgi:hypothetical protein